MCLHTWKFPFKQKFVPELCHSVVVLVIITLNSFPVNIVNNISQEKLFSILQYYVFYPKPPKAISKILDWQTKTEYFKVFIYLFSKFIFKNRKCVIVNLWQNCVSADYTH
jgi:hypothetical protein